MCLCAEFAEHSTARVRVVQTRNKRHALKLSAPNLARSSHPPLIHFVIFGARGGEEGGRSYHSIGELEWSISRSVIFTCHLAWRALNRPGGSRWQSLPLMSDSVAVLTRLVDGGGRFCAGLLPTCHRKPRSSRQLSPATSMVSWSASYEHRALRERGRGGWTSEGLCQDNGRDERVYAAILRERARIVVLHAWLHV